MSRLEHFRRFSWRGTDSVDLRRLACGYERLLEKLPDGTRSPRNLAECLLKSWD